jgi:hypothetical protein
VEDPSIQWFVDTVSQGGKADLRAVAATGLLPAGPPWMTHYGLVAQGAHGAWVLTAKGEAVVEALRI